MYRELILGPVRRIRRRRQMQQAAAGWSTDVAGWAQDQLGFAADAIQRDLLQASEKRLILNCTRQWGKSTVTAVKVVHRAYFEPGSLIVVISPSLRQSGEFVDKADEFLSKLGIKAKGDGHNAVSRVLPNGSRIVGLPGTEGTIRGYSAASLVVIDEASRVSDEQYKAVMPMLAVRDGGLWLMSTPRGKRGFFYRVWANDGEEWKKVIVPATECPRIRPEFLEWQKTEMGEDWFGQEYLCQFVDVEDTLFDRDVLTQAVRSDVRPLF